MPDSNGNLTKAELEKAAAILSEKNKRGWRCHRCQEADLTLTPSVVSIRPHMGGGIMIGGPEFPQVMLVCPNCGFTELHNAVSTGILPQTQKGSPEGRASEAEAPEVEDD